jgi:hypothetical protein
MDQDALDAWRIRCGFPTWEAAADALGLSKAHMSRYKSGQRPIPRIVANACAGVEARLLARSALALRTMAMRAAGVGASWSLEDRVQTVPSLERSALGADGAWQDMAQAAPRRTLRALPAPASASPELAAASPVQAALAAVASAGYAYAADATKSRLTKPRGERRLSLLTPTPAAKTEKGDRS